MNSLLFSWRLFQFYGLFRETIKKSAILFLTDGRYMTRHLQTLPHAKLDWQGAVPHSAVYNDIYYNPTDGQGEAEFVFLRGTNIDRALEESTSLVIGETGFGTGLNFLLTWNRWRQSKRRSPLTFVSVEAAPLNPSDLQRAHAPLRALSPLAQQVRSVMPPPSRGMHLRTFEEGRVRLLLLYGDASEQFRDLSATVDLWYLDGFAPSKNRDMWSDNLFDQIARLSRPGTRLATFTAAGFVRRALADRGFDMRKAPGFGTKRERLIGTFNDQGNQIEHAHPWLPIRGTNTEQTSVAVIGGGLAGRWTAKSLKDRGLGYQLFADPATPPASEVPAAIVAPRFLLDDQPISDLISAAYAYTVSSSDLAPFWLGKRGLALYPASEADAARQRRLLEGLAWGEHWIADRQDHLFLPQSGTLDAAAFLETLPAPDEASVQQIIWRSDGWWLVGIEKDDGPYTDVVVAAGQGSGRLLPDQPVQLTPRWGRTFQLPEKFQLPKGLNGATFSGKGTLSTRLSGHVWAGSSFSAQEGESEETAFAQVQEKLAPWLDGPLPAAAQSWSNVRATTRDRMPYAGALTAPQAFQDHIAPYKVDAKATLTAPAPTGSGLHMLAGFGSKGWQLAPLLSEMIAATIAGDPVPVGIKAQASLSPLRDIVRATSRGSRPKKSY